ncbi:hypothetical protein Tco_1512805, partial [Tanacetum coccineum]
SPDYVLGPEHPPSPDYVPGPRHPPSPIDVPYIPEPEYPKYLAPSDAEAPLEDQPLPADASPTTLSPGYVADSDPDEDPKEDPEKDHTDYPTDRGDYDDEPSDDDDDDDDTNDEDEEPFEDENDDEEEEDHLAPANSSAIPIVDPVPSAGDTEAFETDESAPTPRSPQIKVRILQKSQENSQNRTNTDTEIKKRIQNPGECYQSYTSSNALIGQDTLRGMPRRSKESTQGWDFYTNSFAKEAQWL